LVDGKVAFRWCDSARHNEQELLTDKFLTDKFLRRYLLHLFPEGFVRVRNFGSHRLLVACRTV